MKIITYTFKDSFRDEWKVTITETGVCKKDHLEWKWKIEKLSFESFWEGTMNCHYNQRPCLLDVYMALEQLRNFLNQMSLD